jgi:methyltransferase family protein
VTPGVVRVSADWLDLREPADAAARAEELVEPVRRYLTGRPLATVHDLGAGTGSMGRWLAPRLPGAQHWVLHDRDPDLLKRAADGIASTTADGAPVTVEVREDDITELRPGDLDGASLVTASALLDMLTGEEIDGIVAACASAGCPVLLTISVVGRVELTPPDPLDSPIAEAFNAHQRRTIAGDACGAGASRRLTAGDACGAGASRRLTEGRRLLGPDAVHAAAEAFRRYGMDVRLRPSPWWLGPDQAGLAVEWLRGWLDAACEQRPELTGPARSYETRRLADARAGQLRVVVHHCDLLAGWR